MSEDTTGRTREVFRASGGRLLLGVCAVGAIAILVDVVVRADVGAFLLIAPWVLIALWGVYVVAVASCIAADPTGVHVQNILRRTFVPWNRVTRIVMRWQVVITLDDGKTLTCFGGPSRTRPRRLGPGGTKEAASAESDVPAALRRWKGDAVPSEPRPTEAAAFRRSWDLPALISGVVLFVWAAASVAVAYA